MRLASGYAGLMVLRRELSSLMIVPHPGSGSPVVRQKLNGQSLVGVSPVQLLFLEASDSIPGPKPP